MRRALGMVAVAAAMAVTGCGGDDSGSGGEKAPTKAEFVKQANAICAAGTKKINAAVEKAFGDGGQPTVEEVTSFATETAIPSVEKQIADLDDLTLPKGEEAAFQKVLDAARADLEKVKADPTRFSNGTAFAAANKAALDYGIPKCAE